MKIGIFGGSFNPIHNGHIALANELCSRGEIDKIWLLVSPQNPLKNKEDLMPEQDRLMMVELATKEYPKLCASNFEFQLPRPSFMVHTLEALRKAYPNHQFILIIGADNWLTFNHWFQPEEIRRHHHIIVYPRKGYDINQAQFPHGVSLVNTPLFPISSTDIRRKLKRKEAVRTWLNPKVEAYIKEKGFF